MRKQPVTVANRRFDSMKEAARAKNLHPATLRYRCYSETERMRPFKIVRPKVNRPNKRAKGVIVVAGGRRFKSFVGAAFFYGVSDSTIRARCASDRYTSYYLWDTIRNCEVTL